MDWDRYLRRKREQHRGRPSRFVPESASEAKQALALGIIGISDYVEFSLSTEPLVDMVRDPDPLIRKKAIHRIAELRTPGAVARLRAMLSDEDEEVRLVAASELERMDREVQKRIHELRTKLREDPLDAQSRFELAKEYIEYARILLADSDLRNFFLENAIDLLDHNLKDDPTNPNYRFHRGLAKRFLGRLEEAVADLKRAAMRDKKLFSALVVLAEIYFLKGRYDLVRKLMSKVEVGVDESDEYHARLLWSN